MKYHYTNYQTDRQLFINQLRLSAMAQHEPGPYYYYLSSKIKIALHRTLHEIAEAPIDQREYLLEELRELGEIIILFCENYPLTSTTGLEKTKGDFFDIEIPSIYTSPTTHDPFGWLQSVVALESCFDGLRRLACIRCGWNTFEPRFIGNKRSGNPIWWYRPLSELVYFIKLLIKQLCIPDSRSHIKLIASNFCNSKGVRLNENSLMTLSNRCISYNSEKHFNNLIQSILKASA